MDRSGSDTDNSETGSAAPSAFFCPIGFGLMRDPVIADDGRSNVEQAIGAGYIHSSQVSNDKPLVFHLRLLLGARIPLLESADSSITPRRSCC